VPADSDDRIKVERLGGLAGFSLPGSHVRSGGELSTSKLSPADQRALDALFQGSGRAASPKPDGFIYRITKKVGNTQKTIEVPEDGVPEAIRNCVTNTLD
jgi:Emfourin